MLALLISLFLLAFYATALTYCFYWSAIVFDVPESPLGSSVLLLTAVATSGAFLAIAAISLGLSAHHWLLVWGFSTLLEVFVFLCFRRAYLADLAHPLA